MDKCNINENILIKQKQERYNCLPKEIRDKLDFFYEQDSSLFQLQKIKSKRIYPEKGDIFELKTRDNIIIHGLVINNHINNINGEDLIMIIFFSCDRDIEDINFCDISKEDLLLPPQIVGKEYWSRGLFYNVNHISDFHFTDSYGFYSVGKKKIFDEYGEIIDRMPCILGIYGVCTIWGIGKKIQEELICEGKI